MEFYDLTPEEIMEFEYEFCKILDKEFGVGPYWDINEELQVLFNERLTDQ